MKPDRSVRAGFVLHEMPARVAARHRALNEAARRAYRLRDVADDPQRAAFYESAGDHHFARALAISAEFEAES